MQLACNAGLNPAVVLSDVLKCNPAYGLNVQTLKIENLYEKEIIDPVKTVVNALIYAVSQAKIALITSVLITEDN
jgi:chaperonin GroEL